MKGAIFDVDGTLLDSMFIWRDVGARYLKKHGLLPQENLGEILFPMTLEEGAAYIKENYPIAQSEEEIIQGVLQTVQDFYYYEASLKNGAEDFLKELAARKIPMVIATSGEKVHVEKAFARLGILQYFEKIFTCTEVGAGKKSPLIFQRAAEYLRTTPEEIFVFEDVLHAILTAKAAGFRTAAVYDSTSEDDQDEIKKNADIYLGDLKEFQKFWEFASKGKQHENSIDNRRK